MLLHCALNALEQSMAYTSMVVILVTRLKVPSTPPNEMSFMNSAGISTATIVSLTDNLENAQKLQSGE